LLGINVGGVPGSDSPQGFLVVIVLIGLVAMVEVVILHRLKWI
jgi:zinc transporter